MNKRKPDEEFARIDLSYFTSDGQEVVVSCPESKDVPATQHPARRSLNTGPSPIAPTTTAQSQVEPPAGIDAPVTPPPAELPPKPVLKEQHYTILYGDTGHSYESILGHYLQGAASAVVEDPYIRLPHQIQNFVRFCETIVQLSVNKKIRLITTYDGPFSRSEVEEKLNDLKQSLLEIDIVLDVEFNQNLHDREIRLDNGWAVKIGRGLDFYQKPDGWYTIGAYDLAQRKCLVIG